MKQNIKREVDKVNNMYDKVRIIIESARKKTYHAVNSIMVEAYWNIGKVIVEEEQEGKKRAEYGSYLLRNLSKCLSKDYGRGFDERNLRNMRVFFQAFPIWNAVRSELSWTHYRLLLKIEKKQSRQFYLEEAIEGNWSTRQLERQINSFYYERLLGSKDKNIVKKEAARTAKRLKVEPQDIVKDPYVLEFLGLRENTRYLESQIENAIIDKLQHFLLELGKGFCFVRRQQRISTDTNHFYIDLVFYNYLLNCFVLIDLKAGKLTHQDIGQMDMYVRIYEDKVKPSNINPTIGIILCTQKDAAIVKYSVLKENKRLFASKYRLCLPTEEELKQEITKDRQLIEMEQGLLEKRKVKLENKRKH
ncbi:MAG: DUF1016 family protein [Candidatus Omnitrophica bacterium]|nr:DUF1016 family protein [Candidatus Omnitrophota bacterium]